MLSSCVLTLCLSCAAAEAPAGQLPEGIASLDVQLPKRGTVFRFSTPRGDVKITARAVSRELTDRASQVAVSLAILLVLLWFVNEAKARAEAEGTR